MKADYDTTVARIAGNIFTSIYTLNAGNRSWSRERIVEESVSYARAIVAEIKRTQPETAAVDVSGTVMIEWLDVDSQAVRCVACSRISYANIVGQRCGAMQPSGPPCQGKMKKTVLGKPID